jgi:hypothetical protein
MSTRQIAVASLRFDGPRFEDNALDVECVGELLAYKRLVMECAKELWRRARPARERLPKGFEDRLTLKFAEVKPGSAIVPLQRVYAKDAPQLGFDDGFDDEFDHAAALIDEAIAAAAADRRLPTEFPKNVIPLFRDFGQSLRSSETLFLQARNRSVEAPYNAIARSRLANWSEVTFEDAVDVVGEVNMANVRGGAFELIIAPESPPVKGKFPDTQEAEVLDALHAHKTARLRVRGIAEYTLEDKQLRKFVRVDSVELDETDQRRKYTGNVKPIWQTLVEIGESAPDDAWSRVPTDLSKRLDHYLYSDDEAD